MIENVEQTVTLFSRREEKEETLYTSLQENRFGTSFDSAEERRDYSAANDSATSDVLSDTNEDVHEESNENHDEGGEEEYYTESENDKNATNVNHKPVIKKDYSTEENVDKEDAKRDQDDDDNVIDSLSYQISIIGII